MRRASAAGGDHQVKRDEQSIFQLVNDASAQASESNNSRVCGGGYKRPRGAQDERVSNFTPLHFSPHADF